MISLENELCMISREKWSVRVILDKLVGINVIILEKMCDASNKAKNIPVIHWFHFDMTQEQESKKSLPTTL